MVSILDRKSHGVMIFEEAMRLRSSSIPLCVCVEPGCLDNVFFCYILVDSHSWQSKGNRSIGLGCVQHFQIFAALSRCIYIWICISIYFFINIFTSFIITKKPTYIFIYAQKIWASPWRVHHLPRPTTYFHLPATAWCGGQQESAGLEEIKNRFLEKNRFLFTWGFLKS